MELIIVLVIFLKKFDEHQKNLPLLRRKLYVIMLALMCI